MWFPNLHNNKPHMLLVSNPSSIFLSINKLLPPLSSSSQKTLLLLNPFSLIKVNHMKRQRSEDAVMATIGKKKAKREVERVKQEEEDFGSGQNDMGWTWNHWEEYCYNWPWLGSVVDEQMSWGSIWLPIWDMDLMGEAFNALYSDVVWDDDIWNLRNQIPNPSER